MTNSELADAVHPLPQGIEQTLRLLATSFALQPELRQLLFKGCGTLSTLEHAITPQYLLLVDFNRLGQERKDVEVVDHDAPAEQLDADEVGGAADHLDKVIALRLLLEKANLVRDSARDVMNRLVFF